MNAFCKQVLVAAFTSLSLAPIAAGVPPATASRTPERKTGAKPAIVLVHGAFADGSGWGRVILLLERDG